MKEGFRTNSKIAKARRFFADNKDEELSYVDLMAKFGCNRRHADWIVSKLKGEGVIEVAFVIRAKTS